MKADVKKHCEECLVCQRNKTLALPPAGLLTPLEIPQQVWSDISMDFIDGLPKAKGFEVVFVVIDRLSKYSHFMALKHPYTTKSVADVFVKEVVRLHGFPSSIVSDREKAFLSNFWKEMFRLAGTKLNRSTAYHPQSNGQMELSARDTVLAALWDQLSLAQQQMKQYVDKKRRHVEYNVGEWLLLKIRPYRQLSLRKKRNQKLSPKYFGPYEILEKKFVGDRTGVQPTLQFINENLEWQAYPDEALKYQKNNTGGWEVLIGWKDLPEHEALWECYNEIQRLYPTFHLEDKMKLEGEGNVRPPPINMLKCCHVTLLMQVYCGDV
ncbi:transposon Tf2-1 polyprotein isoform X1 [Cucumis melo var. makuwa]|uniref:Transposon Tf2-1 polyprotein isoform X1 n=1 Tax=Cucumis melo var. makuwa TaxID=1194695 RepID=A0A5D3DU97_CUCMM|nr:transposon Tf2-1 polyprotein isoform X1 [Cucumis melo var. makuwa]TYK26880.1 transposon Tf2-1 polyprotein isoform X1 [Cucumis melo var. makuwa]